MGSSEMSPRSLSMLAIGLAVVGFILCFWYAWYRTDNLPDNTVETADLVDLAVTAAKIADNAVNQDKIANGYFLNDAKRYFSEFWQKPPTTIAVATGSTATDALHMDTGITGKEFTTYGDINNLAMVINLNFYITVIAGTATVPSEYSLVSPLNGLTLSTDPTLTPASGDTISLTSAIPWANTSSMFDFTTVFSLPVITTTTAIIGLRDILANTMTPGTNNNQAIFFFGAPTGVTVNTAANLHFLYSSGGTDYVSELNIAVVALKDYKLRITCDSAYKLAIWVNDVQYNITTTSGLTANAVTTGTNKSVALTAATDLFADALINTTASSGTIYRTMRCKYMKCLNTWTPNA